MLFSQSQQLSTYALTLYKYETKVKGKPITVRKFITLLCVCVCVRVHVCVNLHIVFYREIM